MSEISTHELPVELAEDVRIGVDAVNAHLSEYLDSLDTPDLLRDAMRYALLGGGKRLRPMLAWLSCRAVGGAGEASLPAGGAVELIHAFSLVHDDLPSMDDDDLRRGRPTLHIEFGQAMAILAGDAMVTLAFDLLQRDKPIGPGASLSSALTRELSHATGRMIAGQVRDTIPDVDPPMEDLERLRLIHGGKTGALIHASCRMGAMCGLGADFCPDDARLGSITSYAQAIGLMFQIVDDLLDVEHSAQHTGKRTGKDADAGKLTYPGVIGVEASRAEIERLRAASVEAVRFLGESARPLEALSGFLASRTR